MTPNNHEWETIRNSEYMDSLEHLCSNILITRGKDGMDLVSIENGTHQHIPAKERKIFNVTGAGDTVIATFTTCLAMGFSKYESAMCANEFGGMVVEKPGTATISKHEFSDVVQMVVNNVRTT